MQYSYAKIRRLSESLIKHAVDSETRARIMEGGEAIRQTNKNALKSAWLLGAMRRLDAELGESLRRQVREDCACCLGGKRDKICREINKSLASVEERIAAVNAAGLVFGRGVKAVGKGRYEVRFFGEQEEWRCVCLKGLEEPMPISYCYCCGGHVKHHLETLLGKELEVKVLSSALSSGGKKDCVFELRELGPGINQDREI